MYYVVSPKLGYITAKYFEAQIPSDLAKPRRSGDYSRKMVCFYCSDPWTAS